MKMIAVTAHLAAGVIGGSLATLAPPSWHLPAFLLCIGVTVVLAFIAHTAAPDGKDVSTVGQIVLLVLAPLVGPSGSVVRRGPAPLLFTLALVFTSAFILVLAVSKGAA